MEGNDGNFFWYKTRRLDTVKQTAISRNKKKKLEIIETLKYDCE